MLLLRAEYWDTQGGDRKKIQSCRARYCLVRFWMLSYALLWALTSIILVLLGSFFGVGLREKAHKIPYGVGV